MKSQYPTKRSRQPGENEFAHLLRQETKLINERKTLASPACGCAGRYVQAEITNNLRNEISINYRRQ